MIEQEIIVLKEIPYKENDKILKALSRTKGNIQIMSRGCRKNNSQLLNSSQLFAYSRCILHKSKDMYILSSCELIDNFYSFRNNIDAFLYGSYILELISYVSQENDTDARIFDMTVSVIKFLSEEKKFFAKLVSAYEIKLASMLGYKPNLKTCINCCENIETDGKFSVQDGGVYCKKCVNYGSGINVTYSEIINLDRILKIKFEHIDSLDINSKIADIIRKFLYYHIGKNNFTTLRLL